MGITNSSTLNVKNKPHLKFYWAAGSCSMAQHVLLKEIGAEFESIESIVTKDVVTLADDLAVLNPKNRVPVLVLDGETITETPSIAMAIAGLAPETHIMGRTPMETIRVLEWINWLSGTVHAHGFGGLLRPERSSDDPTALGGIEKKGFANVRSCFDRIEAQLDGVHAVGDIFTVVDPYLFVFYRWAKQVGITMTEYPKYTTLVSHVAQRPSVKATLEAENIESTL